MGKNPPKKKKSFIKSVFSFLFLLIMIAIIIGAVMFFVVIVGMSSKQLVLDDIDALIAENPLPAAEHLSFTEEGDMTVILDKGDIWYFLNEQLGPDWKDSITDKADQYGMRFSGCGISVNENGLLIDMEFFRGFIRIAISFFCDVDLNDNEITITPEKFRILSMDFPIEALEKAIAVETGSKWSYRPELTFISGIDAMTLKTDTVAFTGKMTTDYVESVQIDEEKMLVMGVAQESTRYIVSAINNFDESPVVCFGSFLNELTADPGAFSEFINEYFTLTEDDSLKLNDKNYGIFKRWIPEYKTEGYTSEKKNLEEEYSRSEEHIRRAIDRIVTEFLERKFKVTGWQLFYDGKTFNTEEFFDIAYDLYVQSFDIANMKICFYADDRGCSMEYPNLSELIDSTNSISNSEVNPDWPFAPGMLIRGKDWEPYAVIGIGQGEYRIVRVDEELFEELMGEPKVPVIDQRTVIKTREITKDSKTKKNP